MCFALDVLLLTLDVLKLLSHYEIYSLIHFNHIIFGIYLYSPGIINWNNLFVFVRLHSCSNSFFLYCIVFSLQMNGCNISHLCSMPNVQTGGAELGAT